MSAETVIQQEVIAREIERIKSEVDDTKEVYRRVCRLLFLDYGVTPTANGLYSLVRKGTMSTPAAVLRDFWATIRSKARIRIERTDMRPELLDFAADMVDKLWERACGEADANLEGERAQIRGDRAKADAEVLEANEKANRKEAEVVRVETLLNDARSEIRFMESRLAAALEGKRNLEEDVAGLREQLRARDEALDRARTDFAAELALSRDQAQQASARFEEASRRAMLDIDRARTASAALQRALDDQRKRSAETEVGLRSKIDLVQREVSDERHRVGLLEGELTLLRIASESRSGMSRQKRLVDTPDRPALLPLSSRRRRKVAKHRRKLPRRA